MSRIAAARASYLAAVCATMAAAILISFALPRSWHAETRESSPTISSSEDSVSQIAKPANPGYMGPSGCAGCHANRVTEFQSTRHFLATCLPEHDRMPAGFAPGRGTHAVPESQARFDMTESDGGFFQTTLRETDAGEQRQSTAIAFVYGAQGGNDEVYFAWHDDRLVELPMVWLAPLDEWGTSPFDRHGSGDYSRDMTIRCIECHNTWFEHVPGSRNEYGHDNIIKGVTCEVCHGPGRNHVDFHREHPQVKEAHAVVRPAMLSRERLMDLCAQCHSNALKHRGPAFSYRPGEILDDYYYTLKTKYPEDDHVANQTTYLRQSRCFQNSDTLTCVTCHNPHQPRSSDNAGAASCHQCHKPADCKEQDRLPIPVRSDCVGCHMPEGRKIQVYFKTERDRYVAPVKRFDHRIAVHPDARLEVLVRWHRSQANPDSQRQATILSAELGKIRREQTFSRADEYRFLAAIDACREWLKYDPDSDARTKLEELIAVQSKVDMAFHDGLWHEREGRRERAIESFRSVLEAKPNHVMAQAKLGTNYAITGQKELARKYLQASAECDSNEPYGPAMLGWLAYLDGHSEEALKYYRQVNEVEPYTAQINHQMGLAYVKMSRLQDAENSFAKAVQIDPNGTASIVALSQVLRRQGKVDESLRRGKQAVQLTRSADPEALLNLAESYADLAKWQEAVEASEKALAATQSQKTQLATQIRIRLAEFRKRAAGGT